MKIPSTNYEIVWHRPGEVAHHSPEKIERPSTSAVDLFPVKFRSTSERHTAYRIRSQFISKARKLTAYIAANPEVAKNPKPILLISPQSEKNMSYKQACQVAAEAALEDIRLALYNKRYGSFKSTNKLKVDRIISEEIRLKKGKIHVFSDVGDVTNPFHRAAMKSKGIWESNAVNCDGLALAAMDYVSHEYPGMTVAELCLLDHRLIALGEITPELAYSPLGAWPNHIHVCDPWSNITCPAPHYPAQFLEKMEKWNADNKFIHDNRDWINPASDKWKACVKQPPEIFVRKHYEKGLFFDHKIVPLPVE